MTIIKIEYVWIGGGTELRSKTRIVELSNSIYTKIIQRQHPSLKMPLRNLQNVRYDLKDGYFKLDKKFNC